MLPGTKYTPEDIVRILRRRLWMILLPVVIGSAAAFWYARQLPNLYRSETVLMLMPQRISDGYVKSALSVKVEDRLTTLREQVLSRPNLEQLILDHNLYSQDRATVSMEKLVERMNHDVTIKSEGTGSVRLTYTSPVPELAQEVVERLAKVFVDENLRDRENVAEVTNTFLDSQLAEAKARLLEQEKTLQEYKRRYGNELPGQAATNLQAMQGTDARLRAMADAADRHRQSRLVLERQLADLTTTQDPVVAAAERAVDTSQKQLDDARAELARLETKYTPDHVDVRAQKRKIHDLEVRVEAESKATPTAGSKPVAGPNEIARQKRIRDIEEQMADLDHQLAVNEDEQKKLRADVSGYESRLNALPTRESELVELTRDYQTLQNTYNGLAAKRQESTLSANLERNNVGEQFRVLEPPRIPENPFSPNRMNIQFGGTLGGLLLGLALVGFLEYRDATFKNEEEIFRLLDLPVLAVIPVMVTPGESLSGRKRVVRLLSMLSGASMVAIGIAVWLWR